MLNVKLKTITHVQIIYIVGEDSDWNVHMERVIRSISFLLSKELESFLIYKNNEETKQILPSLLCFCITLGQIVSGQSKQLWRDLVSTYHITSQLIEAATAALQVSDHKTN